MIALPTRLTCLALLCLGCVSIGQAESSASSASSAASTSVGSASDSIRGSSNSSSRTTHQVAQGDYRIVAVAAVVPGNGRFRLTLQAVALPGAAGALTLELPEQAVAPRGLAAQELVSVRQRPYGLEFARADVGSNTREPFFLVLADDWHRELDARPVTL